MTSATQLLPTPAPLQFRRLPRVKPAPSRTKPDCTVSHKQCTAWSTKEPNPRDCVINCTAEYHLSSKAYRKVWIQTCPLWEWERDIKEMEGERNRFRTDHWFKLPKRSEFPEELHPFPCCPRLYRATCGKHCLGAKQTAYDSSTHHLSAGWCQQTPWWHMTVLMSSSAVRGKHTVIFHMIFHMVFHMVFLSPKLKKRRVAWALQAHDHLELIPTWSRSPWHLPDVQPQLHKLFWGIRKDYPLVN